jgi:hypothetical protein
LAGKEKNLALVSVAPFSVLTERPMHEGLEKVVGLAEGFDVCDATLLHRGANQFVPL